jgi:uncharacterized protein (TIGR02688 family)
VVAFDEVAGSHFKKPEDKQLYKDYMELGSFSRGSSKGTIQGEAGFVFNGNLDGDVETIARTSHLFLPFPDTVRNDMAFHDRWHAYLPGWELPKMQPGYFTARMGFIADYIAEIFHNELRPRSFADMYDRHFHLGSHVEERDRKASRGRRRASSSSCTRTASARRPRSRSTCASRWSCAAASRSNCAAWGASSMHASTSRTSTRKAGRRHS